jgi:hypothetical protein
VQILPSTSNGGIRGAAVVRASSVSTNTPIATPTLHMRLEDRATKFGGPNASIVTISQWAA